MDESGIYPYAQEPPSSFWRVFRPHASRLGNQLIGLAVLGVIGAAVFPVFASVKTICGKASCASNLKQATIGMMMYSADFDDKIPPSSRWMDAITPFMKNENSLRCIDQESTQEYGYAVDSRMGGVSFQDLEDPAHQAWAFDSSSNYRNASDPLTSLHPETDKVKPRAAFLDGHVGVVNFTDMWVSRRLGRS